MELIQSELALATITTGGSSMDTPVYNATTVPINQTKETNLGARKRTHSNTRPDQSTTTPHPDNYELKPFRNLPARSPVDIQFRDITYSVSAGFRKGEQFFVDVIYSFNLVCRF
jgi:hypothetical protein